MKLTIIRGAIAAVFALLIAGVTQHLVPKASFAGCSPDAHQHLIAATQLLYMITAHLGAFIIAAAVVFSAIFFGLDALGKAITRPRKKFRSVLDLPDLQHPNWVHYDLPRAPFSLRFFETFRYAVYSTIEAVFSDGTAIIVGAVLFIGVIFGVWTFLGTTLCIKDGQDGNGQLFISSLALGSVLTALYALFAWKLPRYEIKNLLQSKLANKPFKIYSSLHRFRVSSKSSHFEPTIKEILEENGFSDVSLEANGKIEKNGLEFRLRGTPTCDLFEVIILPGRGDRYGECFHDSLKFCIQYQNVDKGVAIEEIKDALWIDLPHALQVVYETHELARQEAAHKAALAKVDASVAVLKEVTDKLAAEKSIEDA